MSSSAKKGGPVGVSQKTEKSDGVSTGSASASKTDTLATTPSKTTKHGVTKKSSGSSNKAPNENAVNPTVLNQQALENLYSSTYVEDYIDCIDNIGDDLVRHTSRMIEMGSNYMTYMRELESAMTILLAGEAEHVAFEQLGPEKKKTIFRLQQVLMTSQDAGDDGLQIMQNVQDYIENKTRQLDLDRKNLSEFCKEPDTNDTTFKDPPPPPTERNIKRARRVRHEIYRPSILGPASLKATSYPETVSNNTRDHDTPHVVTSSRSRDRERDRESQTPSTTNQASTSTTGPVTSNSDSSQPGITEENNKPNGRSERERGTSSRSSTTSTITDHSSSNNEKSGGNGGSGYTSSSNKKQSQKNQTQETQKRTKKRKAKQSSSNSNSKEDSSPQQYAIDPDEPTYCLCDQVSYGEMIGCDNDLCPIEWFHFSCVSLTTKPKGKWYCPKCRGDRPNVMKPKAIFLKELERYNREKEEKA